MLKVILKKELLRVFTDKRLVFSTFILPALSIFIIYSLMGRLSGNLQSDIEQHVGTIYVSNGPDSFVEFYNGVKDDYNLKINFGNDEIDQYRDEIKYGKLDLFVDFENDFDTNIMKYQELSMSPEVKTYYNSGEEYSGVARSNFVYELLEEYEKELLIERFGKIEYTKAFDIDRTNTDSEIINEAKGGSQVLSMILPMLLSIILFAGAMGVGMDSLAGEKERGTMATLLVTPVERDAFALGKVLSLGIVSIVSALCSFVAIIASFPKMSASFGETEGEMLKDMTTYSFTAWEFFQLLVIMLTLVGIYVGLISLISVYSKTVKEAGTYISPIYMLIMIAAFTSMYSLGDGLALYKFMIPVYGSVNAMKELLNASLTVQEFLVTSLSSLLVTFILVKIITKAFNSEKVIFNT